MVRTLQELHDTLGGDRRLTICRELTKRHEEKLPEMTLADSLSYYEVNEPRGGVCAYHCRPFREEMKKRTGRMEALSLEEHMAHYESQGIDRKGSHETCCKRPWGQQARYLSGTVKIKKRSMDFILTDPARFLRERKRRRMGCEGLLREMQTPKSFLFSSASCSRIWRNFR